MKPGLSRGMSCRLGSTFYPGLHTSANGQFVCPIQLFDDGTFSGTGCRTWPEWSGCVRCPRAQIPVVVRSHGKLNPLSLLNFPGALRRGKKFFFFAQAAPVCQAAAGAASNRGGRYVRASRNIAQAVTSNFRITATMANLRRAATPPLIRR
jgi:hypothetical protein